MPVVDDNHPKPRGKMSRVDYMNQVCYASTASFMMSLLNEKGHNIDSFCNCFTTRSIQSTPPEDDHNFALSYFMNNVIGQRDFIENDNNHAKAKSNAIKPIMFDRKAYEKVYGLSEEAQLAFSKKSLDVMTTCILEMTSK